MESLQDILLGGGRPGGRGLPEDGGVKLKAEASNDGVEVVAKRIIVAHLHVLVYASTCTRFR